VTAAMQQRDAVAPAGATADVVYLGWQGHDREALETAWLMLADGHDRMAVLTALQQAGHTVGACIALVNGAEEWTGQVVSGRPRWAAAWVAGR